MMMEGKSVYIRYADLNLSEDDYRIREKLLSAASLPIRHEGKILSVASTFMPFKDEFEIDVRTIDTEHRRMGLATVVSAALMIHALENGLVPHWDAANEASVGLALKLGYTNPEPWEAYYLKPLE